MTLLRAEGLTCSLGTRVVLSDVRLEVGHGELLIVLGANGAGKTTLLRTLARQAKPTSGRMALDGRELATISRTEFHRRVGYLPQSEVREWPLTVAETVRLGRLARRGMWRPFTKEDGDVVEDALAATGLRQLRDRPITQLSGGEWRRATLARALAQQTELLLLDEPTTGLDLRYQMEILDLVGRLARDRRLACVISMHDLNLAGRYGGRFALLAAGRVLADGTHDQVLTPELIRQAFGVSVRVIPDPEGGRPLLVPVGG